jgi:hypothetical protein
VVEHLKLNTCNKALIINVESIINTLLVLGLNTPKIQNFVGYFGYWTVCLFSMFEHNRMFENVITHDEAKGKYE